MGGQDAECVILFRMAANVLHSRGGQPQRLVQGQQGVECIVLFSLLLSVPNEKRWFPTQARDNREETLQTMGVSRRSFVTGWMLGCLWT
jgi:hypothetical protein